MLDTALPVLRHGVTRCLGTAFGWTSSYVSRVGGVEKPAFQFCSEFCRFSGPLTVHDVLVNLPEDTQQGDLTV